MGDRRYSHSNNLSPITHHPSPNAQSRCSMPMIYTIGFTQLSLAEFIGLLRKARVDAVIDTRLRNTSQLAGWAKRDDLAFLLREGFALAYEHIEPFAPSGDLLDSYRADHDWNHYATAYRALLVERDAAA